jgi:ribosome assembly protein 1
MSNKRQQIHEQPRSGDQEFDEHIEFGFQITTFQGPLCAEPVEGIAYFVQFVDVDSDGIEEERGIS